MDTRISCFLVAFVLAFILKEASFVQGQEDVNVNSSVNKNNSKKGAFDAASTHYFLLTPLPSGQERAFCQARGSCNQKTLVCPSQCPERKPRQNKKRKGCFIDCSSKCEVTCKRKPPHKPILFLFSIYMIFTYLDLEQMGFFYVLKI